MCSCAWKPKTIRRIYLVQLGVDDGRATDSDSGDSGEVLDEAEGLVAQPKPRPKLVPR